MGRSVDTKQITETTHRKGKNENQYVKEELDKVSFALIEGKQSRLIIKAITYE